MFFNQSTSAAPSVPPAAGTGPASSAQFAGSPPQTGAASPRGVILVVDDSAMIRAAVGKTLQGAGYETVFAVHGRDGLEAWEQDKGRITAVLSDVFMPEMDGITMARELRRRNRTLPIVLMSSKLDEDSRWVAEEAGFRLLPKPFRDALLLELIARMIRLRPAG